MLNQILINKDLPSFSHVENMQSENSHRLTLMFLILDNYADLTQSCHAQLTKD